jgi:hypothetical protein
MRVPEKAENPEKSNTATESLNFVMIVIIFCYTIYLAKIKN